MKLTIEHISGDRPQFNVALSSGEGREPFITIKGCRVVDGSKGPFVSWPATKNTKTDKWWNHVYASEAFNAAVLAAVRDSEPPPPKAKPKDEAWRAMAADDSMPPF